MEGKSKEIISKTKEMEGEPKEIVKQPKEIRSLPKEMEGEPKEIIKQPKEIIHPAPCYASFWKSRQMYGEKVDAFGENNNFW